ncbi:MAG: signal peptide peptidase SppA [Myxococcota bacterium]
MDQRRALLILLAAFGGLFALFLVAMMVVVGSATGSPAVALRGKAKVGVVEVTDTITDTKEFTEKLRRFVDQHEIKAIVVRIDSPGGSVGASQEMRAEIIRAREKKKVVASLGNVAASGGFYAAVGADKVVANPGTLTGSIGVIMQHPVVADLMKAAKVDMQTYTSGSLKDSGSAFRHPTPMEQTYLQGITTEIHQQFVAAVAESRGLEREKVMTVADGRVITGQTAKELGLVDELGTVWDAAVLALKLAEVPGEPDLVYPPKKGGFLAELMEVGAAAMVKAWRAESPLQGLGTAWPGLVLPRGTDVR